MKIKHIKAILPVLAAGLFFLTGGFRFMGAPAGLTAEAARAKFHKNISVDGICIGGMDIETAANALRKNAEILLSQKSLVIAAPGGDYIFSYPEIDFYSDTQERLESLLNKKPKTAENYDIKYTYYLKGANLAAERICADAKKQAQNAGVTFTPDDEVMFKFTPESPGRRADTNGLLRQIDKSLNNGFYKINLQTTVVLPEITQNELKKFTFMQSRFSTGYSNSTAERKHNIALAASYINGAVIARGEEFSFNKTVGARTAERGFKEAKVIMDGKYIEGVGGGVCQLSTTLYNAVLVAGLKITMQHPHSLSVPYIEPSFDAMVNSGTSDFRFINNTSGNIYLKAVADGNKLSVSVYGEKSVYEYKRISEVTERIPPPAPQVIYGEKEEIVQFAKPGIKSEGYLEVYKNGKLISRRRIRKDTYKPVGEIRKIVGNVVVIEP